MKKPPLNQVWSNKPTLKKSCVNEKEAFEIFKKECIKNIDSLRKHGLFFNFNSDPFLKESILLNWKCMNFAMFQGVIVKVLTKQTDWIYRVKNKYFQSSMRIGYTLTGHDELEPGCATNKERINALKIFKDWGYKTFASIEPIIDFAKSFSMIYQTRNFCDHYKIGLESDTKYRKSDILKFVEVINTLIKKPIYWKDDLLKQAGINRSDLPSNCVNRDYF